jgi:hypothetical protein
MNAKSVALLAMLAAGSAGAAYAQPPDVPPPDEVAPPADSYMDQPPPPDAYAEAQPQEDLQPPPYDQPYERPPYDQPYERPPYDQPYERPDTSYVRPYRGGAVDISFFYEQLSPYGHWVQRGPYGWVWLPFGLRAGWRPYALGRWVMTDYGWTWVSEEPFGWATYHYGRWIYDPEYGWEWVPGYEWGPAWVAWRTGAGYIGWAPLPPEVRFRVGIGLDFGGINLNIALGPSHFCFVEERSFLAPRVAVYVQPPARNVTIINNTTNITNYTVVNNRVVNQGIAVQHVEQVTGRRVERFQVAVAKTGDPRATQVSQVRGNQLTVFQPSIVRRATPPPPPPVHVRASGADLERKHQEEAQALQQQQVQERSSLQQIHQRELQRGGASQTGGAYQGGSARAPQRQPGQPAGEQPQVEPRRQQPIEQQRQPQATEQRQPQAEQPRGQQPQTDRQSTQQRQPGEPGERRPSVEQRQPSPQRGGVSGASAASSQELAQRHQAEVQAQQQQHQREQQQLQARQRAEQQSAQRQPPPQAQQRRGQPQQKGEPQQKDKKPPQGPPPQNRR